MNCTRMLRAIQNKLWKQPLATNHQLNIHLPSIFKTLKVVRSKHERHRWRCKDEFISNFLLFTWTSQCWPTSKNLLHKIYADRGYRLENVQRARNEETVRKICVVSVTWLYIYIYIYILRKKNKDRLIHDYKFISIPYFQFLVWTKNMKKKN